MAIDGKDTAFLLIDSSKNGDIYGDLLIRFATAPKNDGKLAGRFSGDTLFADYTFTTGKVKNAHNKNPLAFLKNENGLVLGVGVIESYLGRSYI